MSERMVRHLEAENFRLRRHRQDRAWNYAFGGFVLGTLCCFFIIVGVFLGTR